MGKAIVTHRMDSRRFTLGDAMIMVAAVAIGLAGSRTYHASLDTITKAPAPRNALSRPRIAYVWPILASMTLVVPVLRWSQFRGRYRRLSRRPGTAACHAAAVGIALAVATSLDRMVLSTDPERLPLYLCMMVHRLTQYSAPAVAAVWVTMWLSGPCRPDSDWIGRLGGFLGIVWIARFLLVELQIWT